MTFRLVRNQPNAALARAGPRLDSPGADLGPSLRDLRREQDGFPRPGLANAKVISGQVLPTSSLRRKMVAKCADSGIQVDELVHGVREHTTRVEN